MDLFKNIPWVLNAPFLLVLSVFSTQLYDRYIILRSLVLLVSLGLFLVWKGRKKLSVNPLALSILALVIWEMISLFWSFSIANTFKYVTLTFVSFLVVLAFSNQKAERNLKFLLILNTGIISVYIISAAVQILTQGMEPYGIHSLSLNKNLFAGFILLSLPLSIISLKHFNGKWTRVLYSVILASSLLLIIVLQSRAVYLALLFFIIFGVFFCFYNYQHSFGWLIRTKLKQFFLIPLIVLTGSLLYLWFAGPEIKEDFFDKINIVSYFSKAHPEELTQVTENNYKSIETRKILWESSLKLFSDKPLTGIGKGNWRIAVGKYATPYLPDRISQNKTFSHAHNDFLQQLTETGLIGFFLFIVPVLVLVFAGLKSAFKENRKFEIIVIACGLCAFLVFAFFDFPFQQVEHRFLFYFQLLLLYQLLSGKGLHGSGMVLKIRTDTVLLLVLICLGITSIQLRSDYHALKSVQLEESNDAGSSLIHLEKAKNRFYDITPTNFPLDYMIGKHRMNKGAFDEAFPFVESALHVNPYEVRIINDYGVLLNYKGKQEESLVAFRKASRLAPYFEDPIYNMVAIYYFDKQYLKATEILENLKDSPKKRDYQNQIRQEAEFK